MRKRDRLICLVAVITIFRFWGLDVWAKGEPRKNPIKIVANKMTYNQNKGSVFFEGNVTATQKDLSLRADRLEVFFQAGKSGEKAKLKPFNLDQDQQIEKIIARGNVSLHKGDKTAKCGLAVYDLKQKKILLTDGPLLTQKQNQIKGEKIVFYVDKDVVEILGNKSRRVEAIFVQDSNNAK